MSPHRSEILSPPNHFQHSPLWAVLRSGPLCRVLLVEGEDYG